jgi:hypothetical protein
VIGVAAAEVATRIAKVKLWLAGLPECPERDDMILLADQLQAFNGNVLEFIQRMDAKVTRLAFATDAGQDLIRADLHNLPFLGGQERDRALDRLHRALVSKPPDDTHRQPKGKVIKYGDREMVEPPVPKELL